MADLDLCALAARTPVGLLAETSAATLRARLSNLIEHPTLVDERGEPLVGGFDARLDPELRGRDRMLALAKASLRELFQKLALEGPPPGVLVHLAVPEPRPGWTRDDAQWLARELARPGFAGGAELVVQVHATGHAGGLSCLAELSSQSSPSGASAIHIIGGVDSYIHAATLGWLRAQGLLRQGRRDGLIPGEAAAFVAVANRAALRERGLSSLGRVVSGSSVRSQVLAGGITPPSEQGSALSDCIQAALAHLPASALVDDVYCDINGQRERAEEWGFALLRTASRYRGPSSYFSVTDMIGDVGAASGLLQCILAARAWTRGYANGPHALVWSRSFSGTRASLLLCVPSTRGLSHA